MGIESLRTVNLCFSKIKIAVGIIPAKVKRISDAFAPLLTGINLEDRSELQS